MNLVLAVPFFGNVFNTFAMRNMINFATCQLQFFGIHTAPHKQFDFICSLLLPLCDRVYYRGKVLIFYCARSLARLVLLAFSILLCVLYTFY